MERDPFLGQEQHALDANARERTLTKENLAQLTPVHRAAQSTLVPTPASNAVDDNKGLFVTSGGAPGDECGASRKSPKKDDEKAKRETCSVPGAEVASETDPGTAVQPSTAQEASIEPTETTLVTEHAVPQSLLPAADKDEYKPASRRLKSTKTDRLPFRGVPRMEGHLYKWTNYLKGWQRRLFVLENGVLSYYVERTAHAGAADEAHALSATSNAAASGNPNAPGVASLLSPRRLFGSWNAPESPEVERACKGRINLQLAVITRHDTELSRLIIDTGTQIYHLRAESNDLCQQWLDALLRSKSYFERLARRAAARRLKAVGDTPGDANLSAGDHPPSEHAHHSSRSEPGANGQPSKRSPTPGVVVAASRESAPGSRGELEADRTATDEDDDEEDEDARLEREFGEEDEATLQARQAREELLAELVRFQGHVREAVTQISPPDLLHVLVKGLWNEEPSTESAGGTHDVVAVLSALLELLTWCIHVLQSDGALWRHRLVAERARALRAEAEGAALQRQLDALLRELERIEWFSQASPEWETNDRSRSPSQHVASVADTDDGTGDTDEFFDAGSGSVVSTPWSSPSTATATEATGVEAGISATSLTPGSSAIRPSWVPSSSESLAERTWRVLERLRRASTEARRRSPNLCEANLLTQPPASADNQLQSSTSSAVTETSSSCASAVVVPQNETFVTIPREPRRRLPISDSETPPKPSLWSILKDAVGKDLSRISIPVVFNEPISFLQRLVEDVEGAALLDRAAATVDPALRLLLVAAFAVSHYASTLGRTGKPFNPLLGETFEFVTPEPSSIRVLCEQVSHHPPVSASYAVGRDERWVYHTTCEVRNKFWGKSIEVFPYGKCHVHIPEFDDHITYRKATTCVHNILVGKMWIDNYGEMVLVNHRNGYRCVVKLTKTGAFWGSRDTYGSVSGRVFDADGRECPLRLAGSWLSALRVEFLQEPLGDQPRVLRAETVWTRPVEPPPGASGPFHMTQFAIALNELTEELRVVLPPTDSRFRPDQRFLENADYSKATAEKLRLEEKQRAARKAREQAGKPWKPLWFEPERDPQSGDIEWSFNGRYWSARQRYDWSQCPDIF